MHKALFEAFDAVVRPEMSEEDARVYEESLVQQNSPKLKITGRKRKEPTSPVVMGMAPRAAKKPRIEEKGVGGGATDGLEGVCADVEMTGVEEVANVKADGGGD